MNNIIYLHVWLATYILNKCTQMTEMKLLKLLTYTKANNLLVILKTKYLFLNSEAKKILKFYRKRKSNCSA